jgi:hypothetical protein
MPVTRSCANCGTPLAPGQDWCLECGTAAPGSLGGGPSWRQALTVIALTLLIVGGAVAASYAALSSQSTRATTAPRIVAVTAPQPAAPAAPATPAPTTTTPAVPKLPPAATKIPPLPKATPTPKAVIPPVTTPAPTHTTPAPSTGGRHSNQTGQVGRAILLDPNAASTYNPYSLPDASFGDPSLAIDGDPTTAWTYTLNPSTAGKTAVGLMIDFKSPQLFQSLKIHVTSPGMGVEFYGANGDPPVSITDPAWTHLATRSHIKKLTSVSLKTAGKTFRRLLIWITHAPGSTTTGAVGIYEASVIR